MQENILENCGHFNPKHIFALYYEPHINIG